MLVVGQRIEECKTLYSRPEQGVNVATGVLEHHTFGAAMG